MIPPELTPAYTHPPSTEEFAPAASLEAAAISIHASGARLDAGLAADRQQREQCAAQLRARLRQLHRLDAVARGCCVVAGLLLLGSLAAFLGGALTSQTGLAYLGLGLFSLTGGLLTVSGGLAVGRAVIRRRTLHTARRNAVPLPEGPAPIAVPSASEDPVQARRDRQTYETQLLLHRTYQDERTASDLCMWAAYGCFSTELLLALFWALGSVRPEVVYPAFGCLLAIASGFVLPLPFAAPLCARKWYRRKRMLRAALRAGFTVRDPARCPSD